MQTIQWMYRMQIQAKKNVKYLKEKRGQWLLNHYPLLLFTQRQAMQEHLCSHMATVCQREKLAKHAAHRCYTFCYAFNKNCSTTLATPSSSLEVVIKSADCLTRGWAFSIATPSPAN